MWDTFAAAQAGLIRDGYTRYTHYLWRKPVGNRFIYVEIEYVKGLELVYVTQRDELED